MTLETPFSEITSEILPTPDKWLSNALRQLENIDDCTADENLSPPAIIIIERTGSRLRVVSECVVAQPDIYPMSEVSLAIDFRTRNGTCGILFVIGSDGSGTVFYPDRGSKGWMTCKDAAELYAKRGANELQRLGIR